MEMKSAPIMRTEGISIGWSVFCLHIGGIHSRLLNIFSHAGKVILLFSDVFSFYTEKLHSNELKRETLKVKFAAMVDAGRLLSATPV